MQTGTARVLTAVAFACVTACGSGGDDDAGAQWSAGLEAQPSALLSVWGSSASDVWVVGGHPAGAGPIVLHYDGSGWDQLDTGVANVDLWWVFGFEGGPVFMGGSGGTILRYQDGAFDQPFKTPSTAVIVYGIWGASPDDVWAVGGTQGGGGRGFAWRFDGTAWTPSDQVPTDISMDGTLFKVSGRAADDVWMVGYNNITGTSLHWNGTSLDQSDIQIDGPMLSVACLPERCIAVGGSFNGALFENAGSSWESALPDGGPVLNGVATSGETAYAVGHGPTILARSDTGWDLEDVSAVTSQNLHADWIDPTGGVWAVGGQFDGDLSDGVLLHRGDPISGGIR